MKHTDIYEALHEKSPIGKTVTVCGWVRTFRESSAVGFLELSDGTSFSRLQVVLDKNALSFDAECTKNGASVCCLFRQTAKRREEGIPFLRPDGKNIRAVAQAGQPVFGKSGFRNDGLFQV